MQAKLRVVAVALTVVGFGQPASAGPLDPPPDNLRVWLVERGGKAPRTLAGSVDVEQTEQHSAVFVIPFVKGQRRQPLDGNYSTYVGENNEFWSYAYVDGVGRTPECPAQAACSSPGPLAITGNVRFWGEGQPQPTAFSFYVMSLNASVRLNLSAGWRSRELIKPRGAAIHLVYASGTGVHVGGMTTVEHFTGLTYQVPGPSLAVVFLPCTPQGDGQGVLSGGDMTAGFRTRKMSCAFPFARGASSGPTMWEVDADSTGLTASGQRFAVAVLPH